MPPLSEHALSGTSSGTLTQSVTPVGFLRYGASTSTFAAHVNHPFDSISAIVLDTTSSRLPGLTVTFSTPDSGPSATFADTHSNVTTAISDANRVAQPAQITANDGNVSRRLDGVHDQRWRRWRSRAPTFTANGIVGTYDFVITVTRNGTSDSTSLRFSNVQVATTASLEVVPAGGAIAGQPVVPSASIRPVAGVLAPGATVDFSRDGMPIDSCRGVVPTVAWRRAR